MILPKKLITGLHRPFGLFSKILLHYVIIDIYLTEVDAFIEEVNSIIIHGYNFCSFFMAPLSFFLLLCFLNVLH